MLHLYLFISLFFYLLLELLQCFQVRDTVPPHRLRCSWRLDVYLTFGHRMTGLRFLAFDLDWGLDGKPTLLAGEKNFCWVHRVLEFREGHRSSQPHLFLTVSWQTNSVRPFPLYEISSLFVGYFLLSSPCVVFAMSFSHSVEDVLTSE